MPRTAPDRPRDAGWYDDPWGVARRRWWDGERWTSRVDEPLDAATVHPSLRAGPDAPPAAAAAAAAAHPAARPHRRRMSSHRAAGAPRWRGRERRPAVPRVLPPGAGTYRPGVMVLIAGGFVVAMGARLAAATVIDGSGGGRAAIEVAAVVALSIPLVAAVVLASASFGTGRTTDDVGLRVERYDALGGLAVAALAFQCDGVVVALLSRWPQLVAADASRLTAARFEGPVAVVAVAVAFVVVVPVVSEVFFRGLVQVALTSRVGAGRAVGAQAVLFGAAHALADLGAANVGVVLVATLAGVVFGVTRHLVGRLGPSLAGHAIANAIVLLPLVS